MKNGSEELYEEDESRPKKEERLLWALCYLPFGFIIPFLMKKESSFLMSHVKQSAILFIAYFLLMFLPIPFLGWIFTLIYIILAGFPAFRAYEGEEYTYAPIGKILETMEK